MIAGVSLRYWCIIMGEQGKPRMVAAFRKVVDEEEN